MDLHAWYNATILYTNNRRYGNFECYMLLTRKVGFRV